MSVAAPGVARSSSVVRMGSRRLACAVMHRARYSTESGEWKVPSMLGRHHAACLACQADAARHRLVMKGLIDLGTITETMPFDLATDAATLSVAVESDWVIRRRRSKAAIASASVAAIGLAVVAGRRLRSAS